MIGSTRASTTTPRPLFTLAPILSAQMMRRHPGPFLISLFVATAQQARYGPQLGMQSQMSIRPISGLHNAGSVSRLLSGRGYCISRSNPPAVLSSIGEDNSDDNNGFDVTTTISRQQKSSFSSASRSRVNNNGTVSAAHTGVVLTRPLLKMRQTPTPQHAHQPCITSFPAPNFRGSPGGYEIGDYSNGTTVSRRVFVPRRPNPAPTAGPRCLFPYDSFEMDKSTLACASASRISLLHCRSMPSPIILPGVSCHDGVFSTHAAKLRQGKTRQDKEEKANVS